jgi:glutathione S-transferase
VRIALAEKGIEYENLQVDLGDRPDWLYELNPPAGRVPVLRNGFDLPESEVIMAYLEDRYPDPPLLPADLETVARARLLVHRFDGNLGRDYYAYRRGDDNELAAKLERLEVGVTLYSDIAYVPWVIRARDMLGVALPDRLAGWLAALEQRPSIAAEVEIVRNRP